MRIFLFFTFILIQSGCTSIEVAKEATKASKSIKTSVMQIINIEKKTKEIKDNDESSTIINNSIEEDNVGSSAEIKNSFEEEKEMLEVEKKKENKLVKKQKKIIKIIFLGKTMNEIKSSLGEPQLIRLDGNTKMARFDKNSCRLFLFFNSNENIPLVEHYEIRDIKGNLINNKQKIEDCYKYFNLT